MDSTIEEEEIHQRGYPRIMIREDQLRFLVENVFCINDITSILFLCSGRTIERRMASDFSVIADADLDHLVEKRISLIAPSVW